MVNRPSVLASVLQTIFTSACLFILFRIAIAQLGPEEFGLWSLLVAAVSVGRLAELGLSGSLTNYIARYIANGSKSAAAELLQTAILTLAVFAGALLFALYPLVLAGLRYIVPNDALHRAYEILPAVFVTLYLNLLGTALQSALDGCGGVVRRNVIAAAGSLLLLTLSVVLIPHAGLIGLVLAQVAQAGFVLVVTWVSLLILNDELPAIPWKWTYPMLRGILGYAANLQANSIAMMLFDPLAKILLGRFGGLEAVGYFEVANQVIVKARSLIVAANQALLSNIAHLSQSSPERMRLAYRRRFRGTVLVSVFFYSLVLASLPIVSLVVYKDLSSIFLTISVWLCLAWGVNTVAAPAYFFNMGDGSIGSNTNSHMLMSGMNAGLGFLLGGVVGTAGVVGAFGIAIICGSVFLVCGADRRYAVQVGKLLSRHETVFLATPLIAAFLFNVAAIRSESLGLSCAVLGASILFIALGVLRRRAVLRQVMVRIAASLSLGRR